MTGNNLSKGIIVFAVGVGMGALWGILFAPKSGADTREYLMEGAKDIVNSMTDTDKKITRTARLAVNDAAERVMNATEEGERAYTKAQSA